MPFTFIVQPRGDVDINIEFKTDFHGDGTPFDGSCGSLAHAYPPPDVDGASDLAGDVHFDESETWSETGDHGTGAMNFMILLLQSSITNCHFTVHVDVVPDPISRSIRSYAKLGV